jgi:hypothetical protein
MVMRSIDIEIWLAARTRLDDVTGCRLWRGALFDGYAYGRLPGGRTRKVARALYEHAFGPLGPGMAVRQGCGNRACCEVDHAVVGTRGEIVLAGEGVCARNARKDACLRGHPFDAANTYLAPNGRRRCRTCTTDLERAWRLARQLGAGRGARVEGTPEGA